MRWIVVVLVVGAGVVFGWDKLAKVAPPVLVSQATPAEVYQWRDAQGNLHFGDAPPGVAAKRVDLKPLNTIKGMSQSEIDGALRPPTPAAKPDGKPEPKSDPKSGSAPEVACEPTDTACFQRQRAPRNVAIERLEGKLAPPAKP